MLKVSLKNFFTARGVRRAVIITSSVVFILTATLSIKTYIDIEAPPESLLPKHSDITKRRILDRDGRPITITYQNRWNLHDQLKLHEIPRTLRIAVVTAEDKRFFEHSGVDHLARLNAIYQNIRSLRVVRGASTITEQVVRMIRPRPRTFYSRWLEGFEAKRLEQKFSKAEILEFYLNQVPYAARRRGVRQAADYYFDRDLNTLTIKETLALAVLVRAPGRMDLRKNSKGVAIEKAMYRLKERLVTDGLINAPSVERTMKTPFELSKSERILEAAHFARHIYESNSDTKTSDSSLRTTLDAGLQQKVQLILDGRIKELKAKNVSNGAVLVIDHLTDEVLAWVNATAGETDASYIDGVKAPRQPGSTLKPFLYGLALEKGWSSATLIDDSRLARAVGRGLHSYRNYSGRHYGPIRLRVALGNSLNIPAVRAVQFTGLDEFYARLRRLGFTGLDKNPEYYGEGLALGNAEVTLFDLTRAYATLARGGISRELRLLMDYKHSANNDDNEERVYSKEVSSLIANILSDPEARRLEFGAGSLLRFPVQTAVKTGTSTDYKDAWAVGFSHRYTVGIWMGNLNQRPMAEVTGSTGPALVLRAIFAELNRRAESESLYLSPKLKAARICKKSGRRATKGCQSMDEYFESKNVPTAFCDIDHDHQDAAEAIKTTYHNDSPLRLLQPTPGLELTLDPRIPDELEAFEFIVEDRSGTMDELSWYIDGELVYKGKDKSYRWLLERGTHLVRVVANRSDGGSLESHSIRFYVR